MTSVHPLNSAEAREDAAQVPAVFPVARVSNLLGILVLVVGLIIIGGLVAVGGFARS
jgi:hypothetical protein